MGVGCDVFGDFVEMELHRLCIGCRKDQRRPFVERQANRAEYVGREIALLVRLAQTGSFLIPLTVPFFCPTRISS